MGVAKIVVIEDEEAIRMGVAAALSRSGYDVVECADGESGLHAARLSGVDLILLDLMLPKMDGMTVLAELRKTHSSLPVIILSARGEEDDRVGGLQGGADDYVVKPFSPRELLARVEAVLRRTPERPLPVKGLIVNDIPIDLERREIRPTDKPVIALSETECQILSHLACNRGRAVARDELLLRIWGLSGKGIETRTVDMHVARLRGKLSEACGASAADAVATVRGKGYMLGSMVESTMMDSAEANAADASLPDNA